jgi:hypothetical protein
VLDRPEVESRILVAVLSEPGGFIPPAVASPLLGWWGDGLDEELNWHVKFRSYHVRQEAVFRLPAVKLLAGFAHTHKLVQEQWGWKFRRVRGVMDKIWVKEVLVSVGEPLVIGGVKETKSGEFQRAGHCLRRHWDLLQRLVHGPVVVGQGGS